MAGIYIHIPFCKQACSYCDFHFSVSHHKLDDFVTALFEEIELSQDYLNSESIETIYFGGGTPSILSIDHLNRIIDKLNSFYDLSDLREITIEANPDDLTYEYLNRLKNTIINRLSIGIQSFHDSELIVMNRAHNSQEAINSIKMAQDLSFDNINADIIFGLPDSNEETLRASLLQYLSLDIPHISAYALTIEKKTQLYQQWKKGVIALPQDDQYASQMELLINELTSKDYIHYELSNYALNGKIAVHNTNYWLGKKYLGLGPSAHSYDGKSRRWNVANNTKYIQSILQNNTIPYEEEILTPNDEYNEYIMTRLRTMWGVNLDELQEKFGKDYFDQFNNRCKILVAKKSLISTGNVITIPKDKIIISDTIISELFL